VSTNGKALRAALLLLAVASAAAATAVAAEPVVAQALGEAAGSDADPAARVSAVVTLVAAAVLTAVGCWLAATTTWCVVVALGTGAGSWAPEVHLRLAPRLVRLVVGAVLGTTALAAPSAVASTPASTAAAADGPSLLPQALAGLPLPDRQPGAARPPAAEAQTTPRPAPRPAPRPTPRQLPRRPASTYTVAAGDSLWSIAAEHLQPDPPSSLVERAWRALYDANRPGIGDDPDLIRPGTVLRLPRPLT
jgi:nucleoid-associated protein YgaU